MQQIKTHIRRVASKLSMLHILLLIPIQFVVAHDGPLLIDTYQDSYTLNKSIFILPDQDGSLSIEDVVSTKYASLFEQDTTLIRKAKYHWVSFTLENKLNNFVNWHLQINPKQYNEVYWVTESKVEFYAKNGEYVRNSESCFPGNPTVIPIKVPIGNSITFYVRLNTEIYQEFKPFVDITLRAAEKEMRSYTRSWIILAVLVGVLSSLGFYIFFQFILFRDKSFLYFFLAFFSMALYFITFERVGYAITGSDYITRFTGNYLALLCTFFYIGFSRHFLDSEIRFPQWHKFFRLFQVFYIFPFAIIVLIDLGLFWNFTPFVHTIHIFAFIILLTFALKTYRKGHYLAGYYLWANSIFFIFLCLFIFYVITKPTSETITTLLLASSLKIGSMGQVLLFTLALSNRFGQLNRKVADKQLENERLEKEQMLKIQSIITDINQKLERKVEERTSEINYQKEELQAQAENIEAAYQEITQQKMVIEKAHSQITDSLFYAALIQKAVLPSFDLLNNSFSDSFILFWPRDIVSGDFYWTTQIEDIKLFAVADCTGHGVPGAFMSMLGISLINEIVKRDNITQPDVILNKIRVNLIASLQQDNDGTEIRDGMDIGLCAIYRDQSDHKNDTFTIDYAGSHTPCYIAKGINSRLQITESADIVNRNSKGALYTLKPDGAQISKHFVNKSFNMKTVKLERGDMVYLTSDGIIDQLGGPNYKKFSSRRLQRIILELHSQDCDKQKYGIEKEMLEWMNFPDPVTGSPSDQIDDFCMMGIRI